MILHRTLGSNASENKTAITGHTILGQVPVSKIINYEVDIHTYVL